jgi:hypothetical protein
MTKYAASDLVLTFGGTAIGVHGGTFDIDEEHAAPDVTSFGDNDGAYIAGGVTHRKATYDGFDDTAGTVYAAVAPGTTANLVYTNMSGGVAKTVSAIATKRKRGFKIGDKVTLSVEFQLTGAIT